MLFSKAKYRKNLLVITTFLLILLVVVPLVSVEASVELLYFRALAGPDFVLLEWKTAQEFDNLGFNLYRGLSDDFDQAQKLNSSLIPGQTGSSTGDTYDWQDNDVQIGTQYTYWLEDIDVTGHPTLHDPRTASPTGGNTIPTAPAPGGGGGTQTPTPTRTPTRTPTPTTQSEATATPTRTPASSNPTATTASQTQPTAAFNNPAPTSASQSGPTATPEPAIDESGPAAVNASVPTSETIANFSDSEGAATPLSLVQGAAEEGGQPTGLSAQQIGQGGQDSQGTGAVNSANNSPDSNRPTIIVMALIISVVLLFAGGGGIILLLLKRTK